MDSNKYTVDAKLSMEFAPQEFSGKYKLTQKSKAFSKL